jgi:large subunit ribosomal protein L13
MKTIVPKIQPQDRKWFVIDLEGVTMGRVAVEVANILRGKNKPIFSPHLDNGDNIIAVNAKGMKFSGRKTEQKKYYHHSGYPGGLREISLERMMEKTPDKVFTLAVKRMMPKNRLGRKALKKLHVYAGVDHPHTAQKPEKLEIKYIGKE